MPKIIEPTDRQSNFEVGEELPPLEAEAAEAIARDKFFLVNKNFCNSPLARDRRSRPEVKQGGETGSWFCHLENVTIILPADAEKDLRRAPTAFEVNVLFAILRQAQLEDTGTVEFASRSSLLREFGQPIDNRHRRWLSDALRFWSVASLSFSKFYYAKEERDRSFRRRGKKRLPAPIRVIEGDAGLRIVAHKDWRALPQRFFASVPLPLPHNAAAQNLILQLLAFLKPLDTREPQRFDRFVRPLCRKLGLDHRTRNRALRHALDIAKQWFGERGAMFKCEFDGGRLTIVIFLSKPIVNDPKWEAKRRQAAEEKDYGEITRSMDRERRKMLRQRKLRADAETTKRRTVRPRNFPRHDKLYQEAGLEEPIDEG